MRKVSGQKDPAVVLLRAITTEAGRSERGLFFAEGSELARRAFEFGADVRLLALAPKLAESLEGRELCELAESRGTECVIASEGIISKVLGAKPTPGCVIIARRAMVPLKQALGGEAPLALMVERGENADNLGMLLRSAEAAGATAVILAAGTTDPFSRRAVRGSRGAVFTLPICIHDSALEVLHAAREAGLRVVASSAKAELSHTEVDYTSPVLFVVGNEHVGISNEVRELADQVVRIPMRGRLRSLNIAVAASLLLYEAIRQRQSR